MRTFGSRRLDDTGVPRTQPQCLRDVETSASTVSSPLSEDQRRTQECGRGHPRKFGQTVQGSVVYRLKPDGLTEPTPTPPKVTEGHDSSPGDPLNCPTPTVGPRGNKK